MNPVIITGLEQGGQLTTTTDVDNWPGDHDGLQGPALMDRMLKHAEKFSASIVNDTIKSVDFSQRPLVLQGENKSYLAESVIIATGAKPKLLGLESENAFGAKEYLLVPPVMDFFIVVKRYSLLVAVIQR